MLGQYVRKSVVGSNGSSPQRNSGANIKKAVYENLGTERDIVMYRDTALSMIVANHRSHREIVLENNRLIFPYHICLGDC